MSKPVSRLAIAGAVLTFDGLDHCSEEAWDEALASGLVFKDHSTRNFWGSVCRRRTARGKRVAKSMQRRYGSGAAERLCRAWDWVGHGLSEPEAG